MDKHEQAFSEWWVKEGAPLAREFARKVFFEGAQYGLDRAATILKEEDNDATDR